MSLLNIIQDYQASISKVFAVFKNIYEAQENKAWWNGKVYQWTTKWLEKRLAPYSKQKDSPDAAYKGQILDSDFNAPQKSQQVGFDLPRLTSFIQNNPTQYPNYQDAEKIEREFEELIRNKVIEKPRFGNEANLYFIRK